MWLPFAQRRAASLRPRLLLHPCQLAFCQEHRARFRLAVRQEGGGALQSCERRHGKKQQEGEHGDLCGEEAALVQPLHGNRLLSVRTRPASSMMTSSE